MLGISSVIGSATPSVQPSLWPTVTPATDPSSPTAIILGSVAVGLVGLVVIGITIKHFRKGGTIAGLAKELESKKEEIKKVADMLPLTEDQKDKLDKVIADPSSLLPAQVQQIVKDKVVDTVSIAVDTAETKTD